MKSILNRSSKGFTLIELLVVIAIIAILATIILASLGTARQRARNTRASSEISQMRAQAEIYAQRVMPPSYDGVCDDDEDPNSLVTLSDSVQANLGDNNDFDCNDEDIAWAAGVTLIDGVYFCADSTGFAGPASELGEDDTECSPV